MDVECGLMIKNTPNLHIDDIEPFVWNKILKFNTSKTNCNSDL
jgi:hypothetical protein